MELSQEGAGSEPELLDENYCKMSKMSAEADQDDGEEDEQDEDLANQSSLKIEDILNGNKNKRKQKCNYPKLKDGCLCSSNLKILFKVLINNTKCN